MTVGFDEAMIIGVIIGLVELAKQSGLPKRIAPIVSLALGIAAGIFYVYPSDLSMGILQGIVLGLTAGGFYSGAKSVIQKGGR
ncbi:transposase [Marininema halotolerans]|uniref:Holin n=1 Tax=Marininema halotolerans TaxID=1155944 RepID=A0A1I6URK6_9BACL|nr:transposase [Marininema halotolerans]SFT04003.1 hypothetical protein SAMN05444972_11929 [Marininema halotolerans]